VQQNSKAKRVLNLFSYTCTFSLSAISAGANSVVNIDMAKNALTIGRENHHLNNLSTKNVSFFPYNILKSFSRIRKQSPYDLIIIDPPSFQKGSFDVQKDYEKIIKKLEEISSPDCMVLACLNSCTLDTSFLIQKFKLFAPNFILQERLKNVKEFLSDNEELSLKNMVFIKQ
jgi:23S rRNA (cytosine1962-C5)-methyltransferase